MKNPFRKPTQYFANGRYDVEGVFTWWNMTFRIELVVDLLLDAAKKNTDLEEQNETT